MNNEKLNVVTCTDAEYAIGYIRGKIDGYKLSYDQYLPGKTENYKHGYAAGYAYAEAQLRGENIA